MTEFIKFRKIPRLNRDMIITEKIDGTNAQIYIEEDGAIHAGSRNRWLNAATDNYGFALWVSKNEDELRTILGSGRHYGEWWGQGIQRRYGMDKKVFSLFNVTRWEGIDELEGQLKSVPVIARHIFKTYIVEDALEMLYCNGSYAAPGFMDPEGVMVYHTAAGVYFKLPFEPRPKG